MHRLLGTAEANCRMKAQDRHAQSCRGASHPVEQRLVTVGVGEEEETIATKLAAMPHVRAQGRRSAYASIYTQPSVSAADRLSCHVARSYGTYWPRSSISVCRLLFSTHPKFRSVHRLQGGPRSSIMHLI